MKNYKIILCYEGTDFCGWQRQKTGRTIQGVVEAAVSLITKTKVVVHGAGRTDAGVHALAQAASFQARVRLDTQTFCRALNAVLPGDVRILSLEEVGSGFHARKSAKAKIYRYIIINDTTISPFLRRYALHIPYPLKFKAMRQAAGLFVRQADFSAFSSNKERKPVRTVFSSEIKKSRNKLIYTVEANGFLRYMVRSIVGTLIEVGRGKYPPEIIDEIFASKKRSLAGPTAPAHGLYLVEVRY